MNDPLSIDQVSYPCLNHEHDLCELGDECACSCAHNQAESTTSDEAHLVSAGISTISDWTSSNP